MVIFVFLLRLYKRDNSYWLPGAEAGEKGELFRGYRFSVSSDDKSLRDGHNNVSALNATELHTYRRLRYVNLTTI